jgi:phytoene dehydrogenase-like protein
MIIPKQSKPLQGASPDALVVGAGPAGLLTAAKLLKSGQSVHLTEKLPQAGGRLSPQEREGFTLGCGFSFGDAGWWRTAGEVLGFSAGTIPVTNGGALVHGTKGWQGIEPEELPEWEAYLSRPCTEFPFGGMYGVISKLLEFCASHDNFSLSLESPVTAITGENGLVKSVSLGAELEVNPKNVHYAADYKTLLEVLRGVGVPEPGPERVSWLKKYVKTQAQPGVILEFAHKHSQGEFCETLLLPFSAGDKEERRYLVGSFVSQRDSSLAPEGQSLSTWILPLTESEWGDNHETMKKIRSARRALDKVFASFERSLVFDRVLVLDSTVAPLQKKKGELHPLMKNLFLSSDWAMPNGATEDSLAGTILG